MIILALLLDGDPYREWRTFPWCIYFPALTIIISWALIKWNRKLVIVALGIAAVVASMLVDQLYGDLRFREKMKADIVKIPGASSGAFDQDRRGPVLWERPWSRQSRASTLPQSNQAGASSGVLDPKGIKGMNWEKMEAYRNDPNLTPEDRKLLYIPKSKIQLNDLEMYGGIPPYDRTIIQAVWFAALFPFVAIAAFYLSAANSAKAQKSLPKSDSP